MKLLAVPYKYLYPSALFFVCIGVYSANNDMFQVGETLASVSSATFSFGSAFTPHPFCSASCSARDLRRTSAEPR